MDSDEPRLFKRDSSPSRNYHTRQQEAKPCGCVYCEDNSHKGTECTRVPSYDKRKKFSGRKQTLF